MFQVLTHWNNFSTFECDLELYEAPVREVEIKWGYCVHKEQWLLCRITQYR